MANIVRSYKTMLISPRPHLENASRRFINIIIKDLKKNLYILIQMNEHRRDNLMQSLVRVWQDLASDIGLSLEDVIAYEETASLAVRPPAWKLCNWRKCVCHEMHPCHPMKVCQGCWSVRYCSTDCQKRWVLFLMRSTISRSSLKLPFQVTGLKGTKRFAVVKAGGNEYYDTNLNFPCSPSQKS